VEMTSRPIPNIPKRPLQRKTITKSESPDPPHRPVDHLGSDYLGLNLLDDDEDEDSPPILQHHDLPRQRKTDDAEDGSHKLVIAIDYGTTYTGISSFSGVISIY
jgi:hypothetical protein